jgi:hypothetical protein
VAWHPGASAGTRFIGLVGLVGLVGLGRQDYGCWRVEPRLPGIQAARRRTSQTVAAIRISERASSQPPSMSWKCQNRLSGW